MNIEAEKQDHVALMVVRGEICYKSDNDDQSYGMWCPVNYDIQHGFPEGTNFYTAPPQREWVRLTDEEINFYWAAAMDRESERHFPTCHHAFAYFLENRLKDQNNGRI